MHAANTLGAIAGSLAGGFGLLPALSATGAWQLVVVVLAFVGAAVWIVAYKIEERVVRLVAPALITVLALLMCTQPAQLRHGGRARSAPDAAVTRMSVTQRCGGVAAYLIAAARCISNGRNRKPSRCHD